MRSRRQAAASIALSALAWVPVLLQAQRYSPVLPYAPNANTQPKLLKKVGIEQKLNAQLPLELTFRDEARRTVRLGQYFQGKPVILALVYYQCPMLCNLELNGLERSLHSLTLNAGDDFQLVAVSINPKETPAIAMAKKENYLERYRRPHAMDGWHFLTGQEDHIKQLAAITGFEYAYDPAAQQYAHAAGIMISTPEGRLSRYFYGIEFPSRDLRLGLVEASDHKIGTLADQVLLYCYHYDPASGKYGFMIQRVLQILGSATVIAVAAFVIVSVRRERRTS